MSNASLHHENFTQDAFRFFSIYRLVFSLSLLLIAIAKLGFELGDKSPGIFLSTCGIYALLNAWHVSRIVLLKRAVNKSALYITVAADFIFINIITFATGTLGTGTELAHLVVVGAAGIFLSSKMAFFIAAMSALSLLVLNIYFSYLDIDQIKMFFSAGFTGILFFIFSFTVQFLAARISSSQATALNLEELNDLIVQRLRTGIIVCNDFGRISLFNQAASELLGKGIDLEYLPQKIQKKMQAWQRSSSNNNEYTPGISVNFTRLTHQDEDKQILVFIDDNRQLAQQAQHIKLASLGRLTASIAHEIRNPLSAISHASQLLQESNKLPEEDYKLSQIIHSHCGRLNNIIEDILTLSRRNSANPEKIILADFLPLFKQRLEQSLGRKVSIDFQLNSDDIVVPFDPYHLQQVMDNICQNGLRYSAKETGQEKISIICDYNASGLPYMEIIDDGQGISKEHQDHIFEPFFTTESAGTGLGLYISKELCEANQALISYSQFPKSYFTILFSHPHKQNIRPD